MTDPIAVTFTLSAEQVAELAERVADVLEERERATAEGRRWLTVAEAAAYIGASRQRVYDLRSSGRLSRCGDGGRALIDRQELDRLIGGV